MRYTVYGTGIEVSARQNAEEKWEIGIAPVVLRVLLHRWWFKPVQWLLDAGVPSRYIPQLLRDIIAESGEGDEPPLA